MLQKETAMPFFAARPYAERRYSEATEILDTDYEADYSDDESPRRSLDSVSQSALNSCSFQQILTLYMKFGYGSSHTSLSTPDLPTPDTASRGVFDQQLDKTVQGPTGPHLFRSSIASSIYARSTEIPLYIETSPVQTRFPQAQAEYESPKWEQRRHTFSPQTPKAFTSLQSAVCQLDENQVRSWTPIQVADWLCDNGFEYAIIEKFIINDISGPVLLNLQNEDLKELDIQSFGKRHQLMSSIQSLRDSVSMNSESERRQSRSPPRRNSEDITVSPTGEVLSRGRGRRGRDEIISPAESVSIVGIEQLLPKPHQCSKGENCPKYKKRQRQLAQLALEYPDHILQPGGAIITGNPGNPETAKNMLRPQSEAEPSVVASSDVFGPSQAPKLCAEALNEVQPRDPQESIRQFLSYQHVDPPAPLSIPEIVTSPSAPEEVIPPLSPPNTQSPHLASHLRNLPKLTIPAEPEDDELTSAQRTVLAGSPTATQEYNPYTYGRFVSPADFYRQGTPFSEMDVPVTAIPNGPIARETSQSVPPDMRYGNNFRMRQQPDPVPRASSTRPRPAPLRRVDETRVLTPIEAPSDLKRSPRITPHTASFSQSSLTSDPEVTRSGWMKKRKTTRFLRHEWQDAHFTLRGTNLAMHKDEADARRNSKALEIIDVDDYAVACSSLATSSKLTAAFKRSILRNNQSLGGGADDTAFAFSLIPANKEGEKKALFSKDPKSHYFAVKTRDERIDWMRELMLARALKKGKEDGGEVRVNGNVI